jgi:septal ring factor EnvC (AmiA/AmiB activator)
MLRRALNPTPSREEDSMPWLAALVMLLAFGVSGEAAAPGVSGGQRTPSPVGVAPGAAAASLAAAYEAALRDVRALTQELNALTADLRAVQAARPSPPPPGAGADAKQRYSQQIAAWQARIAQLQQAITGRQQALNAALQRLQAVSGQLPAAQRRDAQAAQQAADQARAAAEQAMAAAKQDAGRTTAESATPDRRRQTQGAGLPPPAGRGLPSDKQ